jgi:hypothetical protein
MRLVAVELAIGVALLAAPAALAQSAAPAASAAPSAPPPAGDPGSLDLGSGFRLSAPIRMSLVGSVLPRAAEFLGCESRGDSVGNSVGGIPAQNYWDVHLIPHLVLSLFSQLGCPVDAGIGGALTYSIPVRGSMGVVFGAGVYAAPGQLAMYGGLPPSLSASYRGAASPIPAAASVHFVWKTTDGHPLHIGFQTLGRGRPGLTFGGGF